MNLHLKKKIDHYFGIPLLICINLLSRFLGLFLRRNHKTDPVHNILVMKFQGMGSLVIAKPALHLLRQTYPNAKIIFWGTASTCCLAEKMPEFDEIEVLNDKNFFYLIQSLYESLLKFWKLKVDWVFDLEVYSKISSILATMTCGRNRVGFAVESVKHRHYTHTHLLFFNRYEYLGTAYMRLIGLALPQIQLEPLTKRPPEYGAWAIDLKPLPSLSDKPYIVINIHAGELAYERRWPKQNFKECIQDFLMHLPKHHIVLIGHGSFEVRETTALDLQDPRILNYAGNLTLEQTIQCLAHSDLVLSNDSAPMHIALSTSVPVVALFGPTKPEAYFPLLRINSRALYHKIYCSPCVHHWDPPPCLGNNQCMKLLNVSEVLNTCYDLLKIKVQTTSAQSDSKYAGDLNYYAGLVYQRK